MLELGSSGSVRGVSSNGHSYRNPRATLAASRWLEHRQLRAESGHPLDCNRATRSGPLGAFAAHGLHKLGTRISVA